jgi:hypothetical protein
MTILREAKVLGAALSEFTTNLFKLFEDKEIDFWDISFIEQKEAATLNEQKIAVRQMMLLIQNMSMQSYMTFAELGVNKQPVDLKAGTEEDRNYQEALLEVHEAFSDDCHFNSLLLAAQTVSPEASTAYELFMSSLLDACSRQSLAFTGHPLHSTAEELLLSEQEIFSRLTLKADLLEKKTVPYLVLASKWFGALAPVYEQKAKSAVDGKGILQEKAADYVKRAKMFGDCHTALTSRLDAIKLERDELGIKLLQK